MNDYYNNISNENDDRSDGNVALTNTVAANSQNIPNYDGYYNFFYGNNSDKDKVFYEDEKEDKEKF